MLFPRRHAGLGSKNGHSSATAVAKVAQAAGAKRLYLVHTDPQHPEDDPIELDSIRRIFPATELAEDLQHIEI
jgi:ribonuclease Z